MKYLIAHLLSGKAKEYHENLTAQIAERFGKDDLSKRIPPHFTLKSPFEATDDQVDLLHTSLESYTQEASVGRYTMNDFGHFGDRVVFLDAVIDTQGRESIETLTDVLSEMEWMTFGRYDNDINLHATLTRTDSMGDFTRIWQYLQKKEPDFESRFDSISLLEFKNGKWNTYSTHIF